MQGDFSDGEFRRYEPETTLKTSTPRPSGAGRYKMLDGRHFSDAFHVLVNYWEIKPSLYESKLAELALRDVSTVCAFVPWTHVETDIYHSLKKFLRAAHANNLKTRLYVMPELGLNYPNAGIPREVFQSNANLAVDRKGKVIYNLCAPNVFPLPSFFSTDVLKRFGNFVIKLGGILGEVHNEIGQDAGFCELVISNTFFNYYRTAGLSGADHGDYSAAHVMAFRDFLDREYPGASGEAFKKQVYEPHNRHRFFAYVERILREKTEMIFARKNSRFGMVNLDLTNPECAPENSYHSLMTEVFDFHPSVERFYSEIVGAAIRGESVFLNSAGVFRRFTDTEKSFLILASLIHTGNVLISMDELFKLSEGFQRKLGELVTVISNGDFMPHRRMRYLSASKFCVNEKCFNTLQRMATGAVSLAAGINSHEDSAAAFHEKLVFLDPKYVVRLVDLVQLLAMAQTGKVVAIPAPSGRIPNYLPDAIAHLEKFTKGRKPLKINLGVPYEVYEYQLGQVVLYDPDRFNSDSAGTEPFFQALLGLAEIRSICQVNDPRLDVACSVSRNDHNTKLLFLSNPTKDAISVRLAFEEEVVLAGIPATDSSAYVAGKSFELDVPAMGVLSMMINPEGARGLSDKEPTWN